MAIASSEVSIGISLLDYEIVYSLKIAMPNHDIVILGYLVPLCVGVVLVRRHRPVTRPVTCLLRL